MNTVQRLVLVGVAAALIVALWFGTPWQCFSPSPSNAGQWAASDDHTGLFTPPYDVRFMFRVDLPRLVPLYVGIFAVGTCLFFAFSSTQKRVWPSKAGVGPDAAAAKALAAQRASREEVRDELQKLARDGQGRSED